MATPLAPRPVKLTITGTDLPGTTCMQYTGITVALQVRKEHVDPIPGDAPIATWQTEIGLANDGIWRFRGPAVHGPTGARFLYLAWIAESPPGMFRRAKLMLDGLPDALLTAAWQEGRLAIELPLTDECGNPRCAAVREPLARWTV